MKKEKKNGETPAAKKGGESKEHKKNWKEYTAMVNDIEQFLSDHVVLRRNVRGYVVVRRSDEERRSLRQAMAAGPDDTDTDVTDVL